MSLNQRMADLTDPLFLNPNNFGEPVLFVKGVDYDNAITVNVIWDADTLPGTNEVDGDGVVLEKRSGRKIRESIKIECSLDVDVDDTADPNDRFIRNGEVALVKRIMADDSGGMQLILCIHNKGITDRGKYRTG